MIINTLGPASRDSKTLDSTISLLKAALPTKVNENPSIGGRLPTAKIWRLLAENPRGSSTSTKRSSRRPKPALAKPTTKLLVLDGDAAQMKIVREALETQGYSTTCMTSAVEALAAIREEAFELVLTDLNMAEMDGIAFLRAAREIDPDLVGIVMTTQNADNAERAMEAGALDYLVKPFQLDGVLPVLERARGVRQLRLKNIHLQQAVEIYELSMVIRLTLDREAVLQKVVDAAMGHNQVSGVSVLLPIEQQKTLRVAAARGENAARDEKKQIPFSPKISRWAQRSLKRVSRLNELADMQAAWPLSLPKMPGGASIPMLSGGRLVGILNFTSKNPGRPVSPEQIKAMNVLAGAAAAALEAASLLEQLRATEMRYRSLSEGAADIIIRYELHPKPHVAYVNPAFASVFGYSRDEIYADSELIFKIVHPDDHPLKNAMLRGDFQSGSTVTLRYLNRNGDVVWMEQRNTHLLNPDGVLIAIEGIARDITERRKLEEQLFQSQKMEAIGLLAGGIAHDFNNMLTVIIGYSDLILFDDSPTPQIAAKVGRLKKAAEHAEELTRQLLAFGRRQLVQPRVLNINKIVESNREMLRRSVGEDIELVTTLDLGLESVRTDASQIQQILINLVVNAKHAMPLGGRITIETKNVAPDETREAAATADSSGPFVMLAVGDTGCGMDATTKARIFEPFFTTKELGKGSGLGLSIVYGIVKQSGGHIRVTSRPGEGARFEILLPRSEEMEASPVRLATPSVGPTPIETIMVVEDQPDLRQLIGIILEKAGHEVLLACDGPEALRICEEHKGKIGLILTDMIMPGMSGPALVESLLKSNAGVRVLYMSGYAGDMVASDRELDPKVPFIQKPFSSEKLTGRIREILDSGVPRTQ